MIYLWGERTTVHMSKSKNILQELVFLYRVGPGNGVQVVRLVGRRLYLLSYLVSPVCFLSVFLAWNCLA